MSRKPTENSTSEARRHHGFSLRSVCWGYREIFARAIQGLFDEGWIGPQRREVTARFFELMNRADQMCFDHVLREFLGALNPRTRWLMDLPGLFSDVVQLAHELAGSRLHYGMTFFRTLGSGGMGDRPQQVRDLISHVRRLREVDADLAVSFIKGYGRLIASLRPEEIGLYTGVGLQILRRDKKKALAFMEGTLKTSESYIRHITRECRLADVQGVMGSLLKALTGTEVELRELGQLDSDDLIERGSVVVCLYRWLYVPARIRYFDDASLNRKWYLLTCLVAAGMIAEDGFPQAHGHRGFRSCRDVVGSDPLRLNLFQVTEFVRVLRRIRTRWPGAGGLLDFGLRQVFTWHPPRTAAERLFSDAATCDPAPTAAAEAIRQLADGSVNFFDTAQRLDDLSALALRAYPGLDGEVLRAFAFLPDFLFPGEASRPPRDGMIADLRRAAEKQRRKRDGETPDEPAEVAGDGADVSDGAEGSEEADVVGACYVYDEWSQPEGDYYRDHCFVYERVPQEVSSVPVPPDVAEQARRVGSVFERFRPDLARKEKYLREGDLVNPDLLVEYLVQRHKEPGPKVRFYEKPRINRRDLAVLILLDASGSTAQEVRDRRRVIEVEKHAALILGQGLAALDDRFAVCGFHTNGPQKCSYFVYKDFDAAWDRQAAGRVLAAHPLNCTRIGPALRHSGFRLSRIHAKRRLIILITDGRPMDDGYDPNTRYAQYDVRMACEENSRQRVHTFGISTEENSVADMEIMFPRRRFAILPDISQLPRVLPGLYVRLTV